MRGLTVAVAICAGLGWAACAPKDCEDEDTAGCEGDGGVSTDTDYALVRLTSDGQVDESFGEGGIARIDLGTGEGNARDALWNVAVDAQDRLVLFGSMRGDDRSDVDRVVVRLSASGAVDTGFADAGVHTLNIGNGGDNARNGLVQLDGKILSSGYLAQATGVGAQTAARVVLLRLNDDGTPDSTFGSGGIVTANPFVPVDPVTTPWGFAEAYVAGLQNGGYVTAGYGRSGGSGAVDVVSLRFSETGTPDIDWGTDGVYRLDVNGDQDRGRNLVVLSDDRVAILGSATPSSGNIDAMVALTTADGDPDETFAVGGYQLFDFGRPDEAFFGGALSPSTDHLAAAGYRAGPVSGVEEDDDATLLVLPVAGGAPFSAATPISDTEDDRFWGVAFEPGSGKILAAGFVVEAGDSRMVVARFNLDGTLDTGFGDGGIVRVNVSATEGTLETARGVVVQSDGKIVIAGVAEHL